MKTRTKGKTISIRLYPEDEELLRDEAPTGCKTLGPVAEKLLLQTLRRNGDEELGIIRQKVVQLEGELKEMREEMKVSVEAILLGIVDQKSLTAEEVKEWVRRRLRNKG